MLKIDQIKRVHVELTTKCNARCPMCPRNYRGFDYNGGYPLCELSLQNFQHIFTPDFCKNLRHQPVIGYGFNGAAQSWYGVNFNGNLGDFSLARDAVPIVQYLTQHDVKININTNGSTRNTDWWAKLALPGVTVGFAIDGLEDTHSLYRLDTDWHKIMANAQAFIAAGGHAIWRFAPFDHNRHQEQQCRDLAKSLGFVRFENIWDGRDQGPVYDRDGKLSHWLGPTDPYPIGTAQEMIQHHLTWFDPATVRLQQDQDHADIACAHMKFEEIYIAADGSVWPCCYLGFYPGKMVHPGNDQLAQLVKQNNALQWPLAHCLEWFDQVEKTWQHANIKSGRLFGCVSHCTKR